MLILQTLTRPNLPKRNPFPVNSFIKNNTPPLLSHKAHTLPNNFLSPNKMLTQVYRCWTECYLFIFHLVVRVLDLVELLGHWLLWLAVRLLGDGGLLLGWGLDWWTGLVMGVWRDEDLLLLLLLEFVLIVRRTYLYLFLTFFLFWRLLLQWLFIFCPIIIITLTDNRLILIFILIFIPYQPLIIILIPICLSIISFSLPFRDQLLLFIRLILTIGLNHFDTHAIYHFLLVHICNMPCAEIHPFH